MAKTIKVKIGKEIVKAEILSAQKDTVTIKLINDNGGFDITISKDKIIK